QTAAGPIVRRSSAFLPPVAEEREIAATAVDDKPEILIENSRLDRIESGSKEQSSVGWTWRDVEAGFLHRAYTHKSIATISWSRIDGTVRVRDWPARSACGVFLAARRWTWRG